MDLKNRLDEFFFIRDSEKVAKDLVGKVILTNIDNVYTGGIITETEAYPSDDCASHIFGKSQISKRLQVQFMQGGYIYAYLIMGVYTMTSIVVNKKGIADVVFIRSIEPVIGIDDMRKRRLLKKYSDIKRIASGPGKLSIALGIDTSYNWYNIFSSNLLISFYDIGKNLEVLSGERINLGLSNCPDNLLDITKNRKLRFFQKDSKFLS